MAFFKTLILSLIAMVCLSVSQQVSIGILDAILPASSSARKADLVSSYSAPKPYNYSLRSISDISSRFLKIVAPSDGSDSFIIMGDRVVSFSKNWTYVIVYSNGTHAGIRDASVGDINMDGVADVAVLTYDKNVYAVDGDNGSLLWAIYPTLSDPYTRIGVMDVEPQDGCEIVLWTSDGGKIFILSPQGYPLDEVLLSDSQRIIDVAAGKLDGEQGLLVVYYDTYDRYRLTYIKPWKNDIVFDVEVLDNFTAEPMVSLDVCLADVSDDNGTEIIIAGVCENGSELLLEVYNSTGLRASGWNKTLDLGASKGWVRVEITDWDMDSGQEIGLVSRDLLCVLDGPDNITVWYADGGEIVDGVFVEQENSCTPLLLWRPKGLAGLYLGEIDTNRRNISMTSAVLIGFRDGVYSALLGKVNYISTYWGSYVLRYDLMELASWRTLLTPCNIVSWPSDSVLSVLHSYSMVRILDPSASLISEIRLSPPWRIASLAPASRYISGAVALMYEMPENITMVAVFAPNGTAVWQYGSEDLLQENLSMAGFGPPSPNHLMLLILKNTTDGSIMVGILNMSSLDLSYGCEISWVPDIIRFGVLDGRWVWVLGKVWTSRIYIIDEHGAVIGVKDIGDLLLVDLDIVHAGPDGLCQIIIYAYDLWWDSYTCIVCDEHLCEVFWLEGLLSEPTYADVVSSSPGREICAIAGSSEGRILNVYASNGTLILSQPMSSDEMFCDFVFHWNYSRLGNLSILISASKNGEYSALIAFFEYESNVSVETLWLDAKNVSFVYGVSSSIDRLIGFSICSGPGGLLVLEALSISLDEQRPHVRISGENITYVSMLGVNISSSSRISIVVDASDDGELNMVLWNITLYDPDGNIIEFWSGARYGGRERSIRLTVNVTREVLYFSVEAKAIDAVGRNKTSRLKVYVDLEPPSIVLQSPRRIVVSGESVSISAYIRDDLWVQYAYVAVGNIVVPMVPQGEVGPRRHCLYVAEIPLDAIPYGDNVASIVAGDFAGKMSYLNFTIVKIGPARWIICPEFLLGAMIGGLCVVAVWGAWRLISRRLLVSKNVYEDL